MKRLTVLLASILFLETALAAETCSRVATINYQEVLVDASSTNKGEGLRYYLEKDHVAKELLDEYQDNNKPSIRSAAMSTTGAAMIIGSFFSTGENGHGITDRNFLLFGGLTLIGINYLISKTNQYHNEHLLSRSVEEYNKRNTPRIFFSPTDPRAGAGLGLGVGQEF
jgi:hypothetical protein